MISATPRLRGPSTRRPRRLAAAAGVAVLVAAAFSIHYAFRVVSILVAYKARQLCSGVFVAGRDAASVVAELEIDDLEWLRYVDASVDRGRRAATASALGVIAREAVYRDAAGCALVLDGREPARPETPVADVSRPAQPLPVVRDAPVAAAVERAFLEADPARPRRTRAVVVVQDGRIVGERYASGVGADTPLLGWSMTKSVMNALAGTLVRAGKMALEDPMPIAEWSAAGDPRRAITLDHLLRMSSGLEFEEETIQPITDTLHMLLAVPDMAAYAIHKPLEAAPGTRWQYSSGTTVILARAMRQAIGDAREYADWPRRALFDPLGMLSAVIETDGAGTFVGSSLMYATARDWARFGMLYLSDGVWNGQRILPEGWGEYTRTPAPADPSHRYGAHFWLDVPDGYGASRAALPADAFHAAGHQGQFVTIVPSRRVVVVRLGATRHRDAWDQAAFVRDVLAALE